MEVREATPADAPDIAALISELGFSTTPEALAVRLGRFLESGEAPLVAADPAPVACLAWHVTPVLHRPGPVGRITMLVVTESRRGQGIGRTLLAEVEARFRARGCVLAEVTSNLKLEPAHEFYVRAGYERTSFRFARRLVE